MKFKNIFKRERIVAPVQQLMVNQPTTVNFGFSTSVLKPSFTDSLMSSGQIHKAFTTIINYYYSCSPVNVGVDWIVDEAPVVRPVLRSRENPDELQHEGEVLTFLSRVSLLMDYAYFISALTGYFLLTGNFYIVVEAATPISSPLSLSIVPPQAVTYTCDSSTGYIETYEAYSKSGSVTFYRKLAVDGFRYFSRDGRFELWHAKNFAPSSADFLILGLSPLNAQWSEVEQYILTGSHNMSRLQRGTTLDGVFSPKENVVLTDDEFNRLNAELREYYSGSSVAGKPFISRNLDFTPANQSKDMDYKALRDDVTTSIFRALRIPLPLIDTGTMTLANMETAKLNLYDNAVLPIVSKCFAELTRCLKPRFAELDNYFISFDEHLIPALAMRRITYIQTLQQLNVCTVNELRAMLGREALIGGDSILAPATSIPVARTPTVDEEDETEEA